MKKIYFLLIAVAVTATAWSQTTRQWVGLTPNAPWTDPNNWATVPGGATGVPVAGDILIFNGINTRVINVPEITLSGLVVENSANVVLANTGNNNKITIGDGPDAIDFKVETGAVLDLDGAIPPNGVRYFFKDG